MRRRVKSAPVSSAVFKAVGGVPAAFAAPAGDVRERWDAWVAWEDAFRRFEALHPELQEACDDVYSRSIDEIPDMPWEDARGLL